MIPSQFSLCLSLCTPFQLDASARAATLRLPRLIELRAIENGNLIVREKVNASDYWEALQVIIPVLTIQFCGKQLKRKNIIEIMDESTAPEISSMMNADGVTSELTKPSKNR
ncbi:hypothetical protein L2E82_31667 [Cichorium intybus]|uniref:Uncharacterized protein n=1 Tax=Cichorium intybus TaxID=13427 RepID=A0ACB9BFW4_CICIN|nr:hypothetical protein L2E82_31667 [Cichorium intybus]